MGLQIQLECSGCEACLTVRPEPWAVLQMGLRAALAAITQWCVYDPYTHQVYCPTCWAAITTA